MPARNNLGAGIILRGRWELQEYPRSNRNTCGARGIPGSSGAGIHIHWHWEAIELIAELHVEGYLVTWELGFASSGTGPIGTPEYIPAQLRRRSQNRIHILFDWIRIPLCFACLKGNHRCEAEKDDEQIPYEKGVLNGGLARWLAGQQDSCQRLPTIKLVLCHN